MNMIDNNLIGEDGTMTLVAILEENKTLKEVFLSRIFGITLHEARITWF